MLAYRLSSAFASLQLAGIEAMAQERGYNTVVAAHGQDPKRALEALRDMNSRRLDGVISISSTANVNTGVVEGLSLIHI